MSRAAPLTAAGNRQDNATATAARPDSATPTAVSGWSIFSGKASAVAPKPAASPAGATAATAATAAAPVYATKAESDAAVVQSLKDALSAAGINFAGLGLAAHEDLVTYPGGSYLNRYISVNTSTHMEGLMTDLVGINPKVAVLDVKRMLGIA